MHKCKFYTGYTTKKTHIYKSSLDLCAVKHHNLMTWAITDAINP